MEIPKQLQNPEIRFVLLGAWNNWKNVKTKEIKSIAPEDYINYKTDNDWKPLGKAPFEKDWTNKGYSYNDSKLLEHISRCNNIGVIAGYGDLIILDIDDKELAEELSKKMNTFTIKTGSGGRHFYFYTPDKIKNRVLIQEKGELRAENYQAVCGGCRHPSGNYYEILKDIPIAPIKEEEILAILKPYLREEQPQTKTEEKTPQEEKKQDTSRSGKEMKELCKILFKKELSFEEVDKEMQVYTKWSSAPEQYKRRTYENAIDYVKSKQQNKEKPKIEDRIKSFLIEDRQKYESLGCGCLNGIYYFGTKLFRDGKPYTAIITSDKKCYLAVEKINEISNYFGLNYKDNFYDEGLDNILSKEAIQKWLYEKTNDITLKSIYEKLIKIFKKYIYLEDERKYSLLACYRIASFFMPVWRARARLFIFAEMGSAKSRLTQIMHNTGFNSIALGDWTLAYLQRLIESTRGETHIDDYETLDEDKKNATTRLIKTGFMKGFKAGKISEGKNRKPETYDLFNTTTLNNTEGLDFISTDRCVTIRIPKISKKEYDKEPNFSEPVWKELRDELYVLGLKYPQDVALTYEAITSDKIRGRLFFIIKPELTIAKLISEELYQQLEDFWSEEIEQRQNIDFETDWEFLAYKQIYKLLSTHSTLSSLSTHSTLSTTEYFSLLDEVVKPVGLELYSEEEFKSKKRSMSIIIGNALSRNPIFKKRQVKGKNQYKVSFEELVSLLQAKGFLRPIKEVLGVDKVDSGDSVASEMGKRQEEIDFSEIDKEFENE